MYPWWEHDGERINVRATSRCGFRLQVAYWMEWSDISPSADRLYERNPGTTLASADGKRYDQSVSLLPPLFPKILKDVAMPSTFFHPFSSFFISLGWSQVDAIQSPNEKTKVFSYPPWDIQDGLRASCPQLA